VLSRKSKYGLKALLVLARAGGDASLRVSEIAAREAIPKKFLEAILSELKRHGFVRSRKGPGGGYALSRKPRNITFGAVVRVLEGPLALVPCVSQTAYRPCEDWCAGQSRDAGRRRRAAPGGTWTQPIRGSGRRTG
jgi:Rrf2 family protein